MASTRKRKIEFMLTFGARSIERAVAAMVCRSGPGWLTDEQLEDIVARQVDDWRATARLNRRNRAIVAHRRPARLPADKNAEGG